MTPHELHRLIHLKSEYNAELFRIALKDKKSPKEIERQIKRFTHHTLQQ